MTGEEAISYIHSRSWLGSRLGLARTRAMLSSLGNPQKSLRFIHIAGTNGKGSVAAMCASVLQTAGCRTGLYTSPYLHSFNERIRVDGEMISDEAIGSLMGEIRPVADSMEDPPTEFELITAMAFLYFKRAGCDIVVLEVGMGGSLDSTNVIDTPELAIITTIGLDHMKELGGTVEEIAEAKAGIIKRYGDVVVYPQSPSVRQVFENTCCRQRANLILTDRSKVKSESHGLDGQYFSWGGMEHIFLPLLGHHQIMNAAVCLTAMEVLREKGWQLSEAVIREGLGKVTWPGRFEVLRRNPLFIVDGGHNPQCSEALIQNLRDYLPERRVTLLTGVLADKDYDAMYALVDPVVERYVTVTPNSPRALTAKDLAGHLNKFGKPMTVCTTPAQGVSEASREAGEDGIVCAFGSLYIVGDIRKCFGKE